jgi:hypothetical protein
VTGATRRITLSAAIRIALDRLQQAPGGAPDGATHPMDSLEPLLRAGLADDRRSSRHRRDVDADPLAAVRTACAFLGAGAREDAYLALLTAHDYLSLGAGDADADEIDVLDPVDGPEPEEPEPIADSAVIMEAVAAVERRCRHGRYRGLTPQAADRLCTTMTGMAVGAAPGSAGAVVEATALARRILVDDHPDHTELWTRLTSAGR